MAGVSHYRSRLTALLFVLVACGANTSLSDNPSDDATVRDTRTARDTAVIDAPAIDAPVSDAPVSDAPVTDAGLPDSDVSTDAGICAPAVDEGTECAPTAIGNYTRCGGFDGTCDETGVESRSVTMNTCRSGACTPQSLSESRSCRRNTEGSACQSVFTGPWSPCGGFTSTCDTTGTQSRTVTTPTCMSGSCNNVARRETRSCMRNTNGASCGSVLFGPWGACGGFTSLCDSSGVQSRTLSMPLCTGSTCSPSTSIESRPCSRNTDGNSCDSIVTCQRGSCLGDACNLIGAACNAPLVCCEPGNCVSSTTMCP